MFGVMVFALNEGKFIGYALRGYLSSPLVEKIVVVEGCVELNKQAANDRGLSRDNTAEVVRGVIAEHDDGRIVYERVGWAKDKSELQNRCMELIDEHAPNVEYRILAGGDEVYDPADLERLKGEIERLKYPDVPLCEFVHFWKRPDLRAVDSAWGARMHRCYRNHGPGMRFGHHAGPPSKPDGSKLGKGIEVAGVRIYHYSAMKDPQDIKDRIAFYQARDRKGKDTWTNWKPGQPTQWTHGGGRAVPYEGRHPPAIADDIWDLVPQLPKPKALVFLQGSKEERDSVKPFLTHLARLCPLTVTGLTNPKWKGVKFRKIENLEKMAKGADLLICASRNLVISPMAKRNIILAFGTPVRTSLPKRGYSVICFDEGTGTAWSGKAAVVNHPAKFLLGLDQYGIIEGEAVSPQPIFTVPSGASRGSTGDPGVPGKIGSSGRISVLRTSPFVVAWDFTNPLGEALSPKHSRAGYGVTMVSGRKVVSRRTVVALPNLRTGKGTRFEMTLPINNLPPNDYIVRFDIHHKGKWGRDRGVKPLEMLFSKDRQNRIWVR